MKVRHCMSVERIYDPKAVEAANGKIKLEIPTPESYDYVPSNPDGSRPLSRIDVDSPNAATSLQALSLLDEQFAEHIGDEMANHVASDERFSKYFERSEDDEFTPEEETIISDAMNELFTKVHYPETELDLSLVSEDNPSDDLKVTVKVSAPSYEVMLSAFSAMTTDRNLSSIAAQFMPLVSDDYDYEDEDYEDEDYLGDDD